MKTCPKCGKEVNDNAKFCGGCGIKFQEVAAGGPVCPKCGNQLKPGAKFCGKCGTKIEAGTAQSAANAPAKDLERDSRGYVRWTMLPGQVAVKIDSQEVNAWKEVKGIVIQDGVKALLFADGKIIAELGAGSYKLDDVGRLATKTPEPQAKGFWNALGRAAVAVGRAIANVFSKPGQPMISVVLVRSTEFPLVFNIKDASTSGIRSDVGLHVLCKVANINAFYQNLLLDRQFVSYEELLKALEVVVKNQVNQAVSMLTPDRVGNNPQVVATLQGQLASAISGVYPFITVSKVLQITADNQAIAGLQKMGEELYVSEQELKHLQKRNDFLNRLQATKNEQELAEIKAANGQEINKGQLEADLKAKKLEIYKQMALTADEQSKFDLMLDAEKQLREAKTQEQIDAAMHEYEKSGMLREQEIDRLRHKGRMADLRDTQEYDMAELKGELALKREQDAYSDERRDKDAAFQDSRRRAEMQLDKEEQQNQLDMLRQAQAIRMERENAEHQRKLEAENAARAHEQAMQQAQLDAEMHAQDNYMNMSAEQIKAAQLKHLDAAAQSAMFNSDHQAELLRMREADAARQNAQQMEMMRMMQQMAMAGMGVNQQHQQEMMAAKQAELNRTREDANRNEDRMLAGVQSTVTAAGVAFSGKAQSAARPAVRKEFEEPAPSAKTAPQTSAKCPNCGADLEPGSSFCGECGNAL